MNSIGKYFPDCSDKVKEMIRRSIAIISPDENQVELLEKLEANTVKDFSISVGVDMRPELTITFAEHGLFFWPFPSSSTGFNIEPLLELWGLPKDLVNSLDVIDIEAGKDGAVTWLASGIIQRTVIES